MNDEELEALLLSTCGSRQMIFNFMKSFSLTGAAQCLTIASPESIEMANNIMDSIIDGYQSEDHSVH